MIRDRERRLLYYTYRNIKYRCYDEDNCVYDYYGGRGIQMCDRWRYGIGDKNGFQFFVEDMGPRPAGRTLDRIDVNGDYEPANCRWASRLENQRNTRRRREITWKGVTLHYIEWAKKLSMNPETLRARVFRRNWPIGRAMTEGVHRE